MGNELTARGRGDWPAVTMVVFRNFQWGAEKRNTTLWYADNFVGTELNYGVEYAIEGQMKRKETTLIEVVLNQELGEPFRRDAMTKPVSVAGINVADMRTVSSHTVRA